MSHPRRLESVPKAALPGLVTALLLAFVALMALTAPAQATSPPPPPPKGEITIVKEAYPESDADFGFRTSPNLAPGGRFSLNDDGQGNGDRKTFEKLAPGEYVVSEDDAEGWFLDQIRCDHDADVKVQGSAVKIKLKPWEKVTCVFKNKKKGKVTIVKKAYPESKTPFVFETTGDLAPGNRFTLVDDGSPKAVETFYAKPGKYEIREKVPPGWWLDEAKCLKQGYKPVRHSKSARSQDGAHDGDSVEVTVYPGSDTVCFFANKKKAKVTIVKKAYPEGKTPFEFRTTGNLAPGNRFTLVDDGSSSAARTFYAKPGYYEVSEDVPEGWWLYDVKCKKFDHQPPHGKPSKRGKASKRRAASGRTMPQPDGVPKAKIFAGYGDQVVCVFVDVRKSKVRIVKKAFPEGKTQFPFKTTGNLAPGNGFTLVDDGSSSDTAVFYAKPGFYSVREIVPEGWVLVDVKCFLSGGHGPPMNGDADRRRTNGMPGHDEHEDHGRRDPTARFKVFPGKDVTCIFFDKKKKEKKGKITIVKDAQPNANVNFSFTSTGGLSPSGFTLNDDGSGPEASRTFSALAAGEYTVTEQAREGWTLAKVACEGGEATVEGATASIDLGPGDEVTCVYTNKKQPPKGKITIVKDAQPNANVNFSFTTSGGLSPSQFTLNDDGSGPEGARTFSDLPAGRYSVTEAPAAGWDLVSMKCSGGKAAAGGATATIDLAPGAQVTCVFTNKKRSEPPKPPVKPKLRIDKEADVKKVRPGEKIVYTISYRNVAPGSTATDVRICDDLPGHVSVVSLGGGKMVDGDVCWLIPKVSFSTKPRSLRLVVRVDKDARAGKKLVNVATLPGDRDVAVVFVKGSRPGDAAGSGPSGVTG